MLCSLVEINHCFQGAYFLHLQGWEVSLKETSMKQAASTANDMCQEQDLGGDLQATSLVTLALHDEQSK
jgi:hypothetical protein